MFSGNIFEETYPEIPAWDYDTVPECIAVLEKTDSDTEFNLCQQWNYKEKPECISVFEEAGSDTEFNLCQAASQQDTYKEKETLHKYLTVKQKDSINKNNLVTIINRFSVYWGNKLIRCIRNNTLKYKRRQSNMKGKFLIKHKRSYVVPTLTLIMMSLASQPVQALANTQTTLTDEEITQIVAEMPDRVTVSYEDAELPEHLQNKQSLKGYVYDDPVFNQDTWTEEERQEEAENQHDKGELAEWEIKGKTEEEKDEMYISVYKPLYEKDSNIKKATDEESKGDSSYGVLDGRLSTQLSNYAGIRYHLEKYFGSDVLHPSGVGNMIAVVVPSCKLSSTLFGTDKYGELKEKGVKAREFLSSLASKYLGIDSSTYKYAWLTPLLIYYGEIDSPCGVVRMFNSLTDAVTREEFAQFTITGTDSEQTLEEHADYDEMFNRQYNCDYVPVQKNLQEAVRLANNKYSQLAVLENLVQGLNFYDSKQLTKADLDSTLTRLEAFVSWGGYDRDTLVDIDGEYAPSRDVNGETNALMDQTSWDYGSGYVKTVKYFDQADLKEDEALVFEQATDWTEGGETGKESYFSEDNDDGVLSAKTVKVKVGTGKYKTVKKNGKKIKVEKTKTVKKTKVVLFDNKFTDDNINDIREKFKEQFTDGSSYHILSEKELKEAKEACNYYKIYATKGYGMANGVLNAYCMDKQVLTPWAAAKVLEFFQNLGKEGYSEGTRYDSECMLDKQGNVNLFDELTFGDLINSVGKSGMGARAGA